MNLEEYIELDIIDPDFDTEKDLIDNAEEGKYFDLKQFLLQLGV
jgi:hypothetical protein